MHSFKPKHQTSLLLDRWSDPYPGSCMNVRLITADTVDHQYITKCQEAGKTSVKTMGLDGPLQQGSVPYTLLYLG